MPQTNKQTNRQKPPNVPPLFLIHILNYDCNNSLYQYCDECKNIYLVDFSEYSSLNQQCKILFAQAINFFDGHVKYVGLFLFHFMHPPHGK